MRYWWDEGFESCKIILILAFPVSFCQLRYVTVQVVQSSDISPPGNSHDNVLVEEYPKETGKQLSGWSVKLTGDLLAMKSHLRGKAHGVDEPEPAVFIYHKREMRRGQDHRPL